ncbi:MAG: alpha/beta fold hydrolase, partial [Deltaproteobacteria bacterium]|nr:alpha/beta fold hydrolase [Deltaproteobacteria bacterium]
TPDGSARLVLGYDPRASVLSATSPVTVEVSSQSDGAFQWTEYTVDLGPNVLAQASVRLVEAQPMGPKTAVVVSDGGEILTLDGEAALDGSFVVASSNAAGLVDIDKSGLVPAADNLNGVFTTIFTQEIGSSKTVIAIDFQPVGGKAKRLETISVGKGTVFSSSSFSLTDSARTNRLVVASVVSGSTVLYALQDFVDWTRFQSLPPVISAFTLAQTRASAGNMTNSLTDSHDRDRQPVDAGTVYSHYLLDLDVLLRSRAVPNWADTAYGQNPPADGTGRIPVVLLHGWQGNVHYRSAARLCDWEHSPVNNFSKLISYYLGTPALNQKYHLYLLRWPSYKHLTMSGELFGRLLADVRLRLPGTDLGRGLSDSTTGVVVITHSTGGLIARTAIETHKAFAGTTSDYDFLRKAIILAGPHHGTPEAVNTWPNNWSFLANKDVATQATSDLSWDSFDGNANIYFSTGVGVVGHRLRYDKDRAQSRWPVAVQNVRDFDQTYLNALGDLQTATYNPWLLWFTKRFATIKDRLAPRYILYSGWTRVTPDPGNFVNNSAAMAYTQTILAIAGYHNDSVLPVCSNLMATSAKDTSFYLPAPSWPDITQDWYPHSRLFSIPDVLSDRTVIVIGSGKDHPLGLDFRLIWDFDHGQTKDGALSKADQADVAGLIDEPMQTKKTVSDDFWMEVYRQGYVRGAMAYNTGQTPSDKELETMTNVLKSDPFFLILEKDLLDVAG